MCYSSSFAFFTHHCALGCCHVCLYSIAFTCFMLYPMLYSMVSLYHLHVPHFPVVATRVASSLSNNYSSYFMVLIKIAGRNINNLRYANDTTLMTESEEELKSLLMKVKNSTFKKVRSWHLVLSLHGKQWVNNGNSDTLYFLGLQNHCRW